MTKYAFHLETKRVREPDFPYDGLSLASPEAVAEFVRSLQDADVEKFLVLYLNTKNRLICLQIQTGTIDHAAVYPREIAKHALLSGAVSVILVHNHPSADTAAAPSPEDKNLTRTIKAALELFQIRTLNHIIISGITFHSFTNSGLL